MLTLEEIVDLEMATDHLDAYNMSVQSKTPYSDLTQVHIASLHYVLSQGKKVRQLILDQETQGESHQATYECLHEVVTN